MIPAFALDRLPRIEFGRGKLARLPELCAKFGHQALLVTGAKSFTGSHHWPALLAALETAGIGWLHTSIAQEPSPQMVDTSVREFAPAGIDVVVGIGGGSVLDAAKAIAGLLPGADSVMDYLEGVGPEKTWTGPATPFIAVPTTAGTGSEATKNAVLSVAGESGFKKSFRHEQLVPQYALVDPDLLANCPPQLIAANGMDALTQLMESYVSRRANPMTDTLALSGLEAVRDSLLPWYENGPEATTAQTGMAYAALLSGITLAQVGLGSVHGLASPLGAFFPMPHGIVCGTLVATATRVNIRALQAREPQNPALIKYANIGSLLCRRSFSDTGVALTALEALLEDWTRHMELPQLSTYGMRMADVDRVVANSRGSSMQTNPLVLTDAEIADILCVRM